MKGYSMDDLVKELGNCVTKTAIMKYEKGIMKPNSSLIISLSNVLNQPVDYFFRPFSFCIDSISFRKKSSLSIKEENAIKEKVGDLIERYVYIEEMCNSFIPLCPVKCELISNKEQVKSISEEMLANAKANATYKAAKEAGADIIFGATYYVTNDKKLKGLNVVVRGYPAKYVKFHNFGDEPTDAKWIGPLQDGVRNRAVLVNQKASEALKTNNK